ncbi:MAG: 50S ribosomal protein L13 [Bifidobacteriaceae bacterium]|jgi:large subunit ribosomal protein L13|nr:50S ribosomal protein L13 [Bifidobacteriaceae bacterium]
MRTYTPKSSDNEAAWYIIDAEGVRLGTLATKVATLIRGKHKANYAPNVDLGDNVIIINAEKVDLSKDKESKKLWRHSGFPGGISSKTYQELLNDNPTRIVEHAVRGMLPKNSLSSEQIKHLKVFVGTDHPHAGQNPVEYKITQVSQFVK